MLYLHLTLPVISFLLLAAHSLRGGDTGGFLVWLALPLLTLGRYRWQRMVLKSFLLWGTLLWGISSYHLVIMRISRGGPWIRLSLIMLAALGIIILSNFLLDSRRVRDTFSRENDTALPVTLIFIITFALLEILRLKAPVKIILLERFLPGYGPVEIFTLSFYAAWIGGKMLDPDKTSRYRRAVWILFSGVFFLQLILGLAGLEKMLMTGKLHLPVPALIISGPLYRGVGFFMPVLFLSAVVLAGPAWCSHLCYIGAWDDRLSRLRRGKILQNPSWAGKVRTGILILAIIIPLVMGFINVPITAAVTAGALFGIAGVALMAIVSSRRGMMVHCTAYCPVGLAANILGRLSPWRITIGEGCNSCGRCTPACRYDALGREDLDWNKPGLSCTLCGDCLPRCRENHISYRFPGLSAGNARTAFIVLIVILHTLFLGVARI